MSILTWRRLRPAAVAALRRLVQTESLVHDTEHIHNTSIPTDRKITRIVNVAIIGAPNAGKSTLINQIVGRKVCAASNKVHTTTSLARAITVEGDTQIIFLDTPGVITEKEKIKYSLPNSMIESYYKSLRVADVVGVLHDVTSTKARESLHWDVARILQQIEHTPCFLIMNKVDMMKEKKPLLSMIRVLTNGLVGGRPVPGPRVRPSRDPSKPRGFERFTDVFMVSALRGDGVSDIKDYIMANAKPASLHYSESDWTDKSPERLIEETVRAKLLDFLPQEIPYKLITDLEYYEDMPDRVVSSVVVTCPSERLTRLISGSGGGRVNQIQSAARSDLVTVFKKPVTLEIRLKTVHKPLE